jgi:uncharacterized DUF497 family protein
MAMDRFERDEEKRETNPRRHGVDFADAVQIFDKDVLESVDLRRDYGEPRHRALGHVDGSGVLFVFLIWALFA